MPPKFSEQPVSVGVLADDRPGREADWTARSAGALKAVRFDVGTYGGADSTSEVRACRPGSPYADVQP